MVVDRPRSRWGWLLALVLLFSANGLFAQAAGGNTNGFNLNIGMNMPEEPQRIDTAIRLLFIITLLTVAPSLVMLMTCFTRIIIVFSFLRNALTAGRAGQPDHGRLRVVYDILYHAAGVSAHRCRCH